MILPLFYKNNAIITISNARKFVPLSKALHISEHESAFMTIGKLEKWLLNLLSSLPLDQLLILATSS